MRIKVLRNTGKEYHPAKFFENTVVDTDDSMAELLIKRGLAEPTDEELTAEPSSQTIRGVPKQPVKAVPADGSVEKATQDPEDYKAKAKHESPAKKPFNQNPSQP